MKRLSALILVVTTSAVSFAVAPDAPEDTRFTWAGQVGGASGTAIASRSVITAKHNGTSTYRVPGGEIYYAKSRTEHPTMDIALLNFDRDLPGWHTLGTDAPIDSPIFMVGFGRTGILNDKRNGYDIWWWSGGKRIAGTNTLHEKWFVPNFGPCLISWLNVNGDAAAVSGDSGGAFFIGDTLVGVMALAFNTTGGQLPDYGFASQNNGVPYHGTGAIDLTDPEVRGWVLANAAFKLGDMNCDGSLNFADINIFVEAFQYPGGQGWPYQCPWKYGDVNADGEVNFADINPFVELLSGEH